MVRRLIQKANMLLLLTAALEITLIKLGMNTNEWIYMLSHSIKQWIILALQ